MLRAATVITLFLLSSCASVQLNKDALASVKSVAIVGFTGTTDLVDRSQAKPKSGFGDVINSVKNAQDVFSGELDKRGLAQGETTYAALKRKLEASMGWKVADRATVAADPTYAKLLKENPNTDSMMVMGLHRVPDVLRASVARNLDAQERSNMCQRLGVDALVFSDFNYVIGDKTGFAMGGIGSITIHPKAVISLAVLDGTEKPLWQDAWAEGQPTKEGFSNTMGVENRVEVESGVLNTATESALTHLMVRFNEAQKAKESAGGGTR